MHNRGQPEVNMDPAMIDSLNRKDFADDANHRQKWRGDYLKLKPDKASIGIRPVAEDGGGGAMPLHQMKGTGGRVASENKLIPWIKDGSNPYPNMQRGRFIAPARIVHIDLKGMQVCFDGYSPGQF